MWFCVSGLLQDQRYVLHILLGVIFMGHAWGMVCWFWHMLETHICVVGKWLWYTLGIWWYMYEVHVLVMLVYVLGTFIGCYGTFISSTCFLYWYLGIVAILVMLEKLHWRYIMMYVRWYMVDTRYGTWFMYMVWYMFQYMVDAWYDRSLMLMVHVHGSCTWLGDGFGIHVSVSRYSWLMMVYKWQWQL